MHLRQYILGLVFLVSGSFALSNTEFTFINHPDGIEITGCVSTCPSVSVVPETIDGVTVTRIGVGAFVSANLDSLTLPNTIKHIGGEAFIDSGLDSIIIPNSVVNTGFDTFEDFDGDVFVIKPADQRFSAYDFSSSSNVYACESVDSSGFPFNCTNAYSDITRVELDRDTAMSLIDSNGHANIPSMYTMIADAAFAMSSLSSITLPNTIQHIGEEAFVSTNLSSLVLPSSVESISRGTLPEFEGDIYIMKPAEQNFNAYDFPSAANIYACNGIDSTGDPIDCIEAYPEVNRTAIDYQTALSLIDSNGHAEIPNAYTIITAGAFTMSNLESITIPNSIKHIGGEAFAGTNLSSVVIPSSVVSLAENSLDFEGNIFFIRPSEEQINYYDLSNPEKVFVCDFDETSCIPLWDDINSSSLALSNTEFTYNVIDGGIEVTGCSDIPTWPWHSCPNHMVIPEQIDGYSVISIGENAFSGKDLFSVSLPNTLISIESWAFEFNNISNIVLPEGLTRIGDGAFANNELVTINIPSSVVEIEGGAFKENIGENFENWNYIQLKDQILLLGCVSSCPSDLVIPQTINGLQVAYIGEEAFIEENINTITLPDGILEIYDEAFAENDLTEVFVPNSVTSLSTNAFKYSTGIQDGIFTYLKINNSALLLECSDSCPSNLIIPETIDGNSVEFVDDGAFESLDITSLTLPTNLKHIEEWGFAYNLIESVTIPFNIISLRGHSFAGNPLETVHFMGNRPEFEITHGDFESSSTLNLVTYCPKTTGWPGQPIEGITPTLDVNCDSDNDGIINTEDAFPFDSSRHLDDIQYSALDLDQNGSFDALTDALILLRYAFGLRGDNLISQAIASDANRTSAEAIEAHIQSLLP